MIRNLQALRIIFCLLIFVFHFTGMLNMQEEFTYGGDAGVAFFFILSGYVLSLGCGKRVESGELRLVPFMKSRLIKLYPLHFVAMLTMVAFSLYEGNAFSVVPFLAQLFLVQAWAADVNTLIYGNAVSWFLGPLFLCYALFPWLYCGMMMKRRKCFLFLLAAYFAVAYPWMLYGHTDEQVDAFLYAFPPLRIADFILGMIAWRISSSQSVVAIRRRISELSMPMATAVELFAVALCAATWVVYPHLPSSIRFSALYWLPFPVAIILFHYADNGRGIISRLFRQRLMQWLGGISFEVYMLHLIAITLAIFAYGRLFGYDSIIAMTAQANGFITYLPLFAMSLAVAVAMAAGAKAVFSTRRGKRLAKL